MEIIVYKSKMKDYITECTDNLAKKFELKPGFDIIDFITNNLMGEIAPESEEDRSFFAYSDDAYIKPTKNGMNFKIVYSKEMSDKDSSDFRFTIGHELGHLFLHMPSKKENKKIILEGNYFHSNSNKELAEWEAEEFAAGILMPKTLFINCVFDKMDDGNTINKRKISELASEFKVSEKSIIIRGRSLGIWD